MSFYEIYKDEVYDLLDFEEEKKLQIRENQVLLVDIKEISGAIHRGLDYDSGKELPTSESTD